MEANNVCSSAIVGQVLVGASNYENWKACVQNYLWVRDLWDVVEQTSQPPQLENEAEFKAWSKRNVAALHAIQISCDPLMLSYIRNMATAQDAWNTLAQVCQLPTPQQAPQAPQEARQMPDRTRILELLKAIKEGDLESTKSLLTSHTHLANAALGGTGFTAFHFTIFEGQLDMIDEFLNTMSEDDVKMQDPFGRTILHHAAMCTENAKIAQCLIRKNGELLTFPDDRGDIPLNSACGVGHKDMSRYLYSITTPGFLLSLEDERQPASFVCHCINNKWFDVALDLLRRRPHLAFVDRGDGINAVVVLSCQPSAFPSGSSFSFWQRWIYSYLKVKQSKPLSSEDDVRINIYEPQDQKKMKNFVRQGIKQIYDLKMIHVSAHELLLLMSETIAAFKIEQCYQGLVHQAILNAAQRGMREFIVEIIKRNLSSESQVKLEQISGPALQMQRELQWFKEVESIIPPLLKGHRNNKGETPYEAFDRTHAELVKEGEKWMKDIAQTSTVVGTLIMTIMFAALFTVPGGPDQNTGVPLLLRKKLFKIFIISDAISLFASTTSVLIFVGVLTSRYTTHDFLKSLPTKLIIGLSSLFISIAAMMVAFSSTVIIMVKGQLEIAIPIVLLAGIPIGLFVWLEFPLLVKIFISTYGPGIFDRKMKWI